MIDDMTKDGCALTDSVAGPFLMVPVTRLWPASQKYSTSTESASGRPVADRATPCDFAKLLRDGDGGTVPRP